MKNETTVNKSVLRKTKINLILDIALFLVFLIVYEAEATGETIHEWLGVGIAVVIIVHILLHWQWVVGVTQRFFQKIKTTPRINYLVAVLGSGGCQNSLLENVTRSQLISCPRTGEQVVSQNWKKFAIPNARIYWWKCAACQGWHILIDDLSEDGPLDNSPPETVE